MLEHARWRPRLQGLSLCAALTFVTSLPLTGPAGSEPSDPAGRASGETSRNKLWPLAPRSNERLLLVSSITSDSRAGTKSAEPVLRKCYEASRGGGRSEAGDGGRGDARAFITFVNRYIFVHPSSLGALSRPTIKWLPKQQPLWGGGARATRARNTAARGEKLGAS